MAKVGAWQGIIHLILQTGNLFWNLSCVINDLYTTQLEWSTNHAAKATCTVIADNPTVCCLLRLTIWWSNFLFIGSVKLLPGPNYPWVCVIAAVEWIYSLDLNHPCSLLAENCMGIIRIDVLGAWYLWEHKTFIILLQCFDPFRHLETHFTN